MPPTAGPPAGATVPAGAPAALPLGRNRTRDLRERVVTTVLFACAALSTLVTVGIVVVLAAETVTDEVRFTRRAQGLPAQDPAPLLERLRLAHRAHVHPRDLSSGERQRAALAAILAGEPEVLLLDEPTRGLDAGAKQSLLEILLELSAGGVALVVATHDVELAARFARRAVLLDGGRVAADGPARQVLTAHPRFAPQLGRLLGDPRFLTVSDVLRGLEGGNR